MQVLQPSRDQRALFAGRLKAWRAARAYNEDDAGRVLGVSGNYLRMIERCVHAASPALCERFEAELLAPPPGSGDDAVETRRIPVVSWVQAGRAACFEELTFDWRDWIESACPDPHAFALRLVGDSMIPAYCEGDLAICTPSFAPRNNALAVAKIAGDAVTFKTLSFRGKQPKHFRLIALNPAYPPLVVSREDVVWIYPVHSVLQRCRT